MGKILRSILERIMKRYHSLSSSETERIAAEFAKTLSGNEVVAMFGTLGMGKTAFVRGLAKGLGNDAQVSSPTFAIVHDYGGNPHLYHFDMYRISTWDDLYSTGFFDYLDMGGILAVEWSENIENALPEGYIRVVFEKGQEDDERTITIFAPGEVN